MATVEHCLFCFEALSANLEKRRPLILSQIQSSWSLYPKGLESSTPSSLDPEEEEEESSLSLPKKTALSHLPTTNPSSSSSSLSQTTAQTTPASSSTFVPIGIHPTRTSQRTPADNNAEFPLFVTWNTVSPRSGSRSLRGCIGTFEALPLSTGLSDYALTSALSDHRFSPISLSELPTLEVSVTLLTDFENAKDAMDWELGVHGIRISFYARNRKFGACYLPDVAVEQGWTKEETIVSLMRKGGWGGKKDKWREVEDMKVVRFQGFVESVGYEEFRDWRKWVEKDGKGK